MKTVLMLVGSLLIALANPSESKTCDQSESMNDDWVDVLRSDPRLQVAVTFRFSSIPDSEEILDRLRKATGVPLSWAGHTEKGKTTFGNAAVSNVPAWKVMELLAIQQVVDGKWEKSGNGFVLHGKPNDFRPVAAIDPAVTDKAIEKQIADAEKARADFAKYHPLGLDSRLHQKLTVVEKHPKLADMLERLSAATGLTFTLGDSLAQHDPELGHLQLTDVRAYSLMEVIAERDLDGGQWEKTDAGYRLEGKSRSLRQAVEPERRSPWLLVAAVGLMLTAVAMVSVFVIRLRKQAKSRVSP